MTFLTTLWKVFTSMLPSVALGNWIPIELAVRLRTLQQGSLNVGNTQQNAVNLTTLAKAEANGNAVWARWNPVLTYKLQVKRRSVPGYVSPIGTNH